MWKGSTPPRIDLISCSSLQIEVRRCVKFRDDLGVYGGWDAAPCTTVITEQDSTVCECGTFGTFAVVAEMVEEPSVDEDRTWLRVIKYTGFSVSILTLIVFVGIIVMTS